MLSIVKYTVLALALAIAAVVVYASTRPDTFRVERKLLVKAPPEKVWPLVSDLRAFNRWNPWLRKDPKTVGTYGATTSGPGARYSWASLEIGSGSMEIVEAQGPALMRMKLDFIKPFEAHNQAEFTLRAEGGGTEVRWAMNGPANLVSKVMDVVFNMDRMVGGDFDQGLANLKALAEQP